jgi:hypothetical protein
MVVLGTSVGKIQAEVILLSQRSWMLGMVLIVLEAELTALEMLEAR